MFLFNSYIYTSIFYPLEGVGRGSETHLQVGKNEMAKTTTPHTRDA